MDEMRFFQKLSSLPLEVQFEYGKLGGFNGIFNLASIEARWSTIREKREFVRRLVTDHGIPLEVMKRAFVYRMTRAGRYTTENAVQIFEDTKKVWEAPELEAKMRKSWITRRSSSSM